MGFNAQDWVVEISFFGTAQEWVAAHSFDL
jgi:hypothetical protein